MVYFGKLKMATCTMVCVKVMNMSYDLLPSSLLGYMKNSEI